MALVALYNKKSRESRIEKYFIHLLTFSGRCIEPDILKLRKDLEECSISKSNNVIERQRI